MYQSVKGTRLYALADDPCLLAFMKILYEEVEKGYEPALPELITGARRRPRGYCVLVLPDGFYTMLKVLVTPDDQDILQRLDAKETSDVTPRLAFK